MEVEKGHKHTQIGLVPEDWDVKTLSQLGRFSKGQGVRKDEALSGDIPCVRYGELYTRHNDYIRIFYSFISKDISLTAKRLKEGDILFAGSGETKEEIGKSVAFLDDLEAYAGGDIVILSPARCSSLYLGYMLNTPAIQKQKASRGQGDAIVHISANQLGKIAIAMPPTIEEQQAIAVALKETDTLIDTLEKVIKKKRNIRQGAIQKLLHPKQDWKRKRLGEIGECVIGLTYKPENVRQTGTLVLRSSNIQNGKLSFADNVYVDIDIPEKMVVQKNDILVCVRNGSRDLIGKCAILEGKAIGETFGAFMSVFRSLYNPFVYFVMQSNSFKTQIREHLGATINQITNKSMHSFAIPFPPKEEQDDVVRILSDIDKELFQLETKLEKMRQLKQGVMQQLLTGKIRLV